MVSKAQLITVLKRLKKRWPNLGAMEIGNPYQNLVGVLLSARTRDEQVFKLMGKDDNTSKNRKYAFEHDSR